MSSPEESSTHRINSGGAIHTETDNPALLSLLEDEDDPGVEQPGPQPVGASYSPGIDPSSHHPQKPDEDLGQGSEVSAGGGEHSSPTAAVETDELTLSVEEEGGGENSVPAEVTADEQTLPVEKGGEDSAPAEEAGVERSLSVEKGGEDSAPAEEAGVERSLSVEKGEDSAPATVEIEQSPSVQEGDSFPPAVVASDEPTVLAEEGGDPDEKSPEENHPSLNTEQPHPSPAPVPESQPLPAARSISQTSIKEDHPDSSRRREGSGSRSVSVTPETSESRSVPSETDSASSELARLVGSSRKSFLPSTSYSGEETSEEVYGDDDDETPVASPQVIDEQSTTPVPQSNSEGEPGSHSPSASGLPAAAAVSPVGSGSAGSTSTTHPSAGLGHTAPSPDLTHPDHERFITPYTSRRLKDRPAGRGSASSGISQGGVEPGAALNVPKEQSWSAKQAARLRAGPGEDSLPAVPEQDAAVDSQSSPPKEELDPELVDSLDFEADSSAQNTGHTSSHPAVEGDSEEEDNRRQSPDPVGLEEGSGNISNPIPLSLPPGQATHPHHHSDPSHQPGSPPQDTVVTPAGPQTGALPLSEERGVRSTAASRQTSSILKKPRESRAQSIDPTIDRVYVDSPTFTREEEEEYRFVSSRVDNHDDDPPPAYPTFRGLDQQAVDRAHNGSAVVDSRANSRPFKQVRYQDDPERYENADQFGGESEPLETPPVQKQFVLKSKRGSSRSNQSPHPVRSLALPQGPTYDPAEVEELANERRYQRELRQRVDSLQLTTAPPQAPSDPVVPRLSLHTESEDFRDSLDVPEDVELDSERNRPPRDSLNIYEQQQQRHLQHAMRDTRWEDPPSPPPPQNGHFPPGRQQGYGSRDYGGEGGGHGQGYRGPQGYGDEYGRPSGYGDAPGQGYGEVYREGVGERYVDGQRHSYADQRQEYRDPPRQGYPQRQAYGDPPRQGYADPPRQGYADPPRQGYADPQRQGYGDPQRQRYADPPRQGYIDPQRQGYAEPPQRQGYADPQRQGYADPQRYGDPQRQGYTNPQRQGYEDPPQRQGYENPPQRQGYGDPQRQGYADPQRQGYADPQRQGYADPQRQGYGDPQRQRNADPQRQDYRDVPRQGYRQGYGDAEEQGYADSYRQGYAPPQRQTYTDKAEKQAYSKPQGASYASHPRGGHQDRRDPQAAPAYRGDPQMLGYGDFQPEGVPEAQRNGYADPNRPSRYHDPQGRNVPVSNATPRVGADQYMGETPRRQYSNAYSQAARADPGYPRNTQPPSHQGGYYAQETEPPHQPGRSNPPRQNLAQDSKPPVYQQGQGYGERNPGYHEASPREGFYLTEPPGGYAQESSSIYRSDMDYSDFGHQSAHAPQPVTNAGDDTDRYQVEEGGVSQRSTGRDTVVLQRPEHNYIAQNKVSYGRPQKHSYKKLHAIKKEEEEKLNHVFVKPKVKDKTQSQSQKGSDSGSPSRYPVIVENPVENEDQGAQELWAQRSATLARAKMNGGKKKGGSMLSRNNSRLPTAGGGGVSNSAPNTAPPPPQPPIQVAHAAPLGARPLPAQQTQQGSNPQLSPSHHQVALPSVTQQVLTEDGQRISVDVNLRLISPPVGVQGEGGAPLPVMAQQRLTGQQYPSGNAGAQQQGEEYPRGRYSADDVLSSKNLDGELAGLAESYASEGNEYAGYTTNPYKKIPPIPTSSEAPRSAPVQSEGSYMLSYLRDKEKTMKGEKPAYKVYGLRDYKRMQKEVRLGTLGPDLDSDIYKERREKMQRQLDYAKTVKDKNTKDLTTKKPPAFPRSKEQDDMLNKRRLAIEYSKNVPKPTVKPKPNPYNNYEMASKLSPIAKPQPSRPQLPPTPPQQEASADVLDLEKLHERHEQDKRNAELIRQKAQGIYS